MSREEHALRIRIGWYEAAGWTTADHWHCTDGSYGFRATDPRGNVYAVENGRQTLVRAAGPMSKAERLRNAAAVILAQEITTADERHTAYAMQDMAREIEAGAVAAAE
ncbi:MAG: hypothetical protein GC201_18930 [Alphaproteobacteria bacterium]|nr:hypothetical protein [Alphaproteobacteria bacterium]